MNSFKERLDERLWDFIKKNFNSENYSNAILDSIQFLGDLIREKSGLDGDGSSLIGNAFGGGNPKIKLNALQTESEKNIQKGIEQILRGIFTAYRNPRSHSKLNDTENDSVEFIIFINHLIKIIDKSKGKFSTDIFLERVFDDNFVGSKKYSEILIESIPINKYFEVAIEIYKQKEKGKIENLRIVWKNLFQKLSETEQTEICELVSEELRFETRSGIIVKNFALFDDAWLSIAPDSRLRAENMIVNLIPFAEKNVYGQITKEGISVTWFLTILKKSELKEQLASMLEEALLSRNPDRQRFVLEYFGKHLKYLDEYLILISFDHIFKGEIESGNRLIYDYVNARYSKEDKVKFKDVLANFHEKKSGSTPHDDLPF